MPIGIVSIGGPLQNNVLPPVPTTFFLLLHGKPAPIEDHHRDHAVLLQESNPLHAILHVPAGQDSYAVFQTLHMRGALGSEPCMSDVGRNFSLILRKFNCKIHHLSV